MVLVWKNNESYFLQCYLLPWCWWKKRKLWRNAIYSLWRIIAVLGSMSLSRRPFVWPEMLHNMNEILLSFLPFTSLHWINSNIWLTTAVGPPCLSLKQSVNHFFVEGYRNWQGLKGSVGMNESETIACLTPSWSWFLVGGYPYKDLSVSLELIILHTFYICWNLGIFHVVYRDCYTV